MGFLLIGHYMIRSLRSAQKRGVTPQDASKTEAGSIIFATYKATETLTNKATHSRTSRAIQSAGRAQIHSSKSHPQRRTGRRVAAKTSRCRAAGAYHTDRAHRLLKHWLGDRRGCSGEAGREAQEWRVAGERTARGWHGWQQRSTRLRRRGSGDTPMSFVIAGNDGGGDYRNLAFVKFLSENLKKKCTSRAG